MRRERGAVHLQAVQAFVRQAMGYIEQTPDKPTRVELIKTLQVRRAPLYEVPLHMM